jgi:hypothetical protein
LEHRSAAGPACWTGGSRWGTAGALAGGGAARRAGAPASWPPWMEASLARGRRLQRCRGGRNRSERFQRRGGRPLPVAALASRRHTTTILLASTPTCSVTCGHRRPAPVLCAVLHTLPLSPRGLPYLDVGVGAADPPLAGPLCLPRVGALQVGTASLLCSTVIQCERYPILSNYSYVAF